MSPLTMFSILVLVVSMFRLGYQCCKGSNPSTAETLGTAEFFFGGLASNAGFSVAALMCLYIEHVK